MLEECRRAEAILYLGHVIEVLDAGKSAHSDHNVSQLLRPALAAREVTLARRGHARGARVERRNASFAQHWAVVRLPEVSDAAGRRILERVASEAGARRG